MLRGVEAELGSTMYLRESTARSGFQIEASAAKEKSY